MKRPDMRLKARLAHDDYAMSRVWVIAEAALEYFIALLTSGAYLAKITSALNFSDSLTGILSSFVTLGCIFQLGSGIVFKNASRVKGRVIAFQMVYQLLFVVVYLTPVLNAHGNVRTGVFLIAYVSAYVLINLVRSQKNSWMLSLVDDSKRGVFTAKKEIVSLISGMVFTYIMGSVIDRYEFSGNARGAFIACACVIFCLNALHFVTLILTKEKDAQEGNAPGKTGSVVILLKNRKVMSVILLCVLFYIAHYAAIPFFGAYQIKELGFSMRFISVLSILYSVIRAVCSPFMGKLADKRGFVQMAFVCFIVEAAGFVITTFMTPENGEWMYSLYNITYAVSMAGINSALLNIVFGYAPREMRAQAIALNYALCGVAGFLSTCAASRIVDFIQASGNTIFGLHMYPQQFMSLVAFVLMLVSIAYAYFGVIAREKKEG